MQNPLKKIKIQTRRPKINTRVDFKGFLGKLKQYDLLTIGCAVFLVLAHIFIIWAIIASMRYYAIYPSLFGSIVAIIICGLAIIDIVFAIGFLNKDRILKIISTVMAVLLLISGSVGTYFISKANTIVGNVLDDGKSDKYETFSGSFVYYKGNKDANNFKTLSDLAGKKVGMLLETSNGLSYIATNLLSKEKIDYATVDYKTNSEMMQGLLDGDVDAIVITSAFRTIYKGVENTPGEEAAETSEEEAETTEDTNVADTTEQADSISDATAQAISQTEESPFAKYLDDLVDFHTFEEELKINTTRTQKNISTDPFNVLLIGYSRTDIGSPVGLADSIILATINPQTYTVAMTSIARDSFAPIACYGGEYDKINSGRSTSRACFIETVEDFIGMDVDYYMELDYLGLVQIVNTIGGIYINNPVAFTLDGIYVPAGEHVFADGQMALQFARERHHMPGGDFDRQQHQKEVIIEIAKKFIESGDITLALKAMDEASDWMSTDLTLAQLTGIFNMLLNTRNYTGLDTFDLVDFRTSRITGNGGLMYYSYDMHLPLWVYLVYQGSYDENMNNVNEIMGNFKTVNQDRNFTFSIDKEYVRPETFSLNYSDNYVYTPDPMPAFWASLTDMSVSEASAWASANGVKLNITYINPGDADYNANYENMVISQSPRYGMLISDYPSGSITAMAPNVLDEDKMVPDFKDKSYNKAVKWAKEHGVQYDIDFDTDVEGSVGKVVSQSPKPYTPIDKVDVLSLIVKAGVYEYNLDVNGHGKKLDPIRIKTGDDDKDFPWLSDVKEDGTTYKFEGWYTEKKGGERVYSTADVEGDSTVYAHWEDAGHEHTWGEWKTTKEATCDTKGERERTCKTCGKVQTGSIDALGHDWGEWIIDVQPEVGKEGEKHRVCRRNSDHIQKETIPALEPDPEPTPEEACTTSGKYWYDGDCHDEPKPEDPDPDPGDGDNNNNG